MAREEGARAAGDAPNRRRRDFATWDSAAASCSSHVRVRRGGAPQEMGPTPVPWAEHAEARGPRRREVVMIRDRVRSASAEWSVSVQPDSSVKSEPATARTALRAVYGR